MHHADARRLARDINKIADSLPTDDWVEVQDKLHMIAKSILGEH